jgi:hypothetical protein
MGEFFQVKPLALQQHVTPTHVLNGANVSRIAAKPLAI